MSHCCEDKLHLKQLRHDLMQPLSTVKMFVSDFQRMVDSASYRDDFQRYMPQAVDRLTQLIKSLDTLEKSKEC